jgi:hypothetical protein
LDAAWRTRQSLGKICGNGDGLGFGNSPAVVGHVIESVHEVREAVPMPDFLRNAGREVRGLDKE